MSKIIEEGYILVGMNSIKKLSDNKYAITNTSGKISYDMVSMDNPSTEKEKQICSILSKSRLDTIKKWNIPMLESVFKSTLYLLSDTGSDANKLAEHFFSGEGKLFSFSSSTNLANEIKNSSQFDEFKKALDSKINNEAKDGSLKKEKEDGTYEILRIKDIALPYYGISEVFMTNDDAAAILGGIQLAIVKYKLFKKGSNTFRTKLTDVFFYDTFGAGWDDACNTMKSYSDGLVAMFVLQHYKNINNPKKYQPFVIGVHIKL